MEVIPKCARSPDVRLRRNRGSLIASGDRDLMDSQAPFPALVAQWIERLASDQ